MWKIFFKKEPASINLLYSLDMMKKDLFSAYEREVKEYFAQKVVSLFDNNMIFRQKEGFHMNLMEALSVAEKEMLETSGLFGRVVMHMIGEEDGTTLVTFGLENEKEEFFEKYGFSLIKRDALPKCKDEELEHNSWKTLLFDIELVNYASGWIRYAPDMEKRSAMQAERILCEMHFKKHDEMSLLEKLNFEKNIRSHPAYEDLYMKVRRIMPKMEALLEQELKETNFVSKAEAKRDGRKKGKSV